MRHARTWLIGLAVIATVQGASAQISGPDPAFRGIDVIARGVDGDSVSGQWIGLSLAGGLAVRVDGEERRISTADLVRITAISSGQPARRSGDIEMRLSGGDVLYGRLVDSGEESVVLDTADLGRVSVPLDAIQSVHMPADKKQNASRSLSNGPENESDDVVLMTNGDRVRGFIIALGADALSIETGAGESTIKLSLVAAVYMAGPKPAEITDPAFRVTLRQTGRVTVTDFDGAAYTVDARLRHGARVSFEADRLVAIDVLGGRWVWLAQEQPISQEHTPMLGLDWPPQTDRNVLGGALMVAGETYEHGIGVHSRSKLSYELKGEYREFVTSFGIDDDSGPHADVSVRIVVDGKPRFEKTGVRAGSLHGPVRLDVARGMRLELLVDFGEKGSVQDRFNWINPALIR